MSKRELVRALEPPDDEVFVYDRGIKELVPIETVVESQVQTEPGIVIYVEE